MALVSASFCDFISYFSPPHSLITRYSTFCVLSNIPSTVCSWSLCLPCFLCLECSAFSQIVVWPAPSYHPAPCITSSEKTTQTEATALPQHLSSPCLYITHHHLKLSCAWVCLLAISLLSLKCIGPWSSLILNITVSKNQDQCQTWSKTSLF